MIAEPRQQLDQHPLRNVEVTLAGDRGESPPTMKVALVRQVHAAESSQIRVRHPRGVADTQHWGRKCRDPRSPVGGEEVELLQGDARVPGIRSKTRPGSGDVLGVDVGPQRAIRAGKGLESRLQQTPRAAGRLNNRPWCETPRDQHLTHGPGKTGRRLEIAELNLCTRVPAPTHVTSSTPTDRPTTQAPNHRLSMQPMEN